jgi:hypothetical protein
MTNTTLTAPAATTTPAFLAKIENSLKTYAVLAFTALTGVAAMAVNGHTVNTFMWVRGALLPLIAIWLYRTAGKATAGNRKAFDKVRTLSLIMPIAIIGVDLIPGVCPLWYAGLQTLVMIPVVATAVLTRNAEAKAAFPKTR